MNNKVRDTIIKYDMLSFGDRVLAAVSGGADSMALICLLLEIKDEFELSLSVCHVNHLLRGEEADRDENFVREFCKAHSIPFYLLRCDVKALSEEKGLGFEECGRSVRYDFFNETSEKIGGAKIATAHTLSDRSETLIFNIARGTSPAGISSIAPVRENIIRPLIDCTREEIENYLSSISQPFVTDSTNCDTQYTRNFIRAEIIPKLKNLNPSLHNSLKNLFDLSSEDSEYFSEKVSVFFKNARAERGIMLSLFLEQEKAIARRIIAAIFAENNVMLSKKLCDEILSLAQGGDFKINVCKNTFFVCKDGFLRFEEVESKEKFEFSLPVILGKTALSNGRALKLSLINREQFENFKENFQNLLKNCIDYDIIDERFVFRNRKSGDKIDLFPRNVTKTLKKLFNESKIPEEKRDIIPVLASDCEVLWVEGIGVSTLAAVKDSTQNILFIEVLDSDDGEKK